MASKGRSARTKGAAGEREFFKELNTRLDGLEFKRNILQSRIGGLDSEAHHPVAIEVKRAERLSLGVWLDQLRKAASPEQLKALAYRQNRGQWKVLLDLTVDEFCELLTKVYPDEYKSRGSQSSTAGDLQRDNEEGECCISCGYDAGAHHRNCPRSR